MSFTPATAFGSTHAADEDEGANDPEFRHVCGRRLERPTARRFADDLAFFFPPEKFGPVFRAADGSDGAALVRGSAGCDRTVLVTALHFRVVGGTVEAIADDYAAAVRHANAHP